MGEVISEMVKREKLKLANLDISKELIEAVMHERLSERYVSILETPYLDGHNLHFGFRSGCGSMGANQIINIFEFAYMCKVWAFYKDYWISSTMADASAKVEWGIGKQKFFPHCGSEIQAIFKASEWLLDKLKGK